LNMTYYLRNGCGPPVPATAGTDDKVGDSRARHCGQVGRIPPEARRGVPVTAGRQTAGQVRKLSFRALFSAPVCDMK
jgi:hypothetical protein